MAVVPEETAVTFFTTRLSKGLPRSKLRLMPKLQPRAKPRLSPRRRARLDQLVFALVPRVLSPIGLVQNSATAPLTKSALKLRNLPLTLSLILMMRLIASNILLAKIFLSLCSHY